MMRAWFNRVLGSGAHQDMAQDAEKMLPRGEMALSETSRLYHSGDFEKYNPDSLVGRKGARIYERMMLDEQVKAVYKFKRDAITSRDFYFEVGEMHGLSVEEAARRVELFEYIVHMIRGSFMDTLNNIMSAMKTGYSINEKIYTQLTYDGKTWWGVERIKLRPYHTFYFHTDLYGNVSKLVQKVGGRTIELDPTKFIHFVVNPDVDEHYGQSELRECYRSWFSKDAIIKFRNIWLERHAGGMKVLRPKGDKKISVNSREYLQLQAMLNTLQAATGVILPSGLEMDSHNPANNVAFREAIEDNDMAIARALLVPNLLGVSPQGKHGSLSQSDSQLEAFLMTLEADTERLAEVLNEQLFRPLGEVNFGDDAWPKLRFKPASESQKLEIISTWKDLVSAGAVKHSDSDESHLRDLLEFPERDDATVDRFPEGDGVTPPTDGSPSAPGQETPTSGETDDAEMGETVAGRGLVQVSAFSKAQRRVDFAVIAKNSDSLVDEYAGAVAEVMDLVVADLVAKGKEGGDLSEDVSKNVRNLKVDGNLKRKLNSVLRSAIREGHKIGQTHAAIELDKAKREAFSRRVDLERFDAIAEDFFTTTAFKLTGNFTDEAVKIIEAEILNGARYDKTWAQVERSIYSAFATRGMISTEQAKDALGEALGVNNPDARVRTVVRTSTFDAINHARYSFFTDPGLDGFVQAMEYSAILDGRTTQICRHLDEENRGNHTVEWYEANPQYKPPNHYNCRSLLVPVTVNDLDSFEEGGEPTIQPQEGFR